MTNLIRGEEKNMAWRWLAVFFGLALALLGLCVVLGFWLPAPATNTVLPLAGVYDCDEYEYDMIWATDVITLNQDGTSQYLMRGDLSRAGTWSYDPAARQVTFVNFRWLTATYQLPGRLHVSTVTSGVDIALDCQKR